MKEDDLVEWFDEYGESILSYILLMVRDYQQAEDLTQETFLKAHKNYSKFEQQSTAKTWLFAIAFNVTQDYFRKKHPLQHYLGLTMHEKDFKPMPEQIVAMNDQTEQLYRTIQQLKLTYRHVIILRKLKEFSTAETADILNWSESKVKMTLKRALAELKNELIKGGFTYERFHG
ncbi:sigma-70 family RNA polymerase sigma factor [Mammaliicoccus sciuri]|uniref:RNA polymerase sigma-70 factor, ECF subfamily n=2 Tax=Sporosarcina newyorkensis TaxID=759851 RepID=A0A1T4YMF1_9BACL|nr:MULTISPECIES: sigma-70 family RNA polymerase sigma factor [Sporosarcina]EGQ21668.1 ECF family DNA-directed RNA polymerase sigma subunit SigX [Sporosarcina newyorkensis 2681]MBY0221273.1 sigma-70 family RNA polymerase sigma factor [Sporosarcina aquimarina]SKB02455.1 RNA polymerase sigma-70 factor, ECF subfamily [Sporosarcina newyorkensis]